MKRVLFSLLTLALLGGTAALLWPGLWSDPGSTGLLDRPAAPNQAEVGAVPTAAGPTTTAHLQTGSQRQPQALPESPDAELLVHVERSDGTALANVTVAITPLSGEGDPGATVDPWRDWHGGPTDSDGDLTARLPAGDYLCATARGGPVKTGLGAGERKRIVIRLPAGAIIAGSVRDRQGRAIAGAEVLLVESGCVSRARVVGHSDAHGEFTVHDIAGHRHLCARHSRYAPSPLHSLSLRPGMRVRVPIVLRSEHGRVDGSVTDHNGRPVADARVLIGSENLRAQAQGRPFGPPPHLLTTDDEGRFTSHPLRPGAQVVRVVATGFGCFRGMARVVADRTTAIGVILAPGASVRGRAQTTDGEPLDGAMVWSGRRGGFGSRRAQTGANGHFELTDLPAGLVNLKVRSRTNQLDSTQLYLRPGQQISWNPRLPADGGGRIRGRLIDSASRPLHGWRVVARSLGQPRASGVETDEDGAFSITDLRRDHPLRLAAHRPGSGWTAFPDAVLEPVQVDGPIVLFRTGTDDHARGTLRGTVVDAGGNGIGAVIEVHCQTEDATASYLTASDGSFDIDSIPAGRLRVTARHPDHPRLRSDPFELAAGHQLDLGRLQLQSGGLVFGELTGPDHSPLEASSVMVLDDSNREAGAAECTGTGYRTPLLTAGRYWLLVQAEETAAVRLPVTVTADRELECNIRLENGLLTRIRVTTRIAAEQYARASIIVLDSAGQPIWTANQPLQHGSTEFQAWLAPDQYRVLALGRNDQRATAGFDVTPTSPPLPIQLQLRAQPR